MSGRSSPSNRVSDVEIAGKTGISKSSTSDGFEPGSKSKDDDGSSLLAAALKLMVASLCGIVFGIALEKSRVFEPEAIRQQMVFENFIMLKTFLAAVASGQLCLCILSVIPKTKPFFKAAQLDHSSCFAEKGLLTSTIGPFILGMGMTMSGACPGMVLAQIGAWVPNAIFSLIGAFVGALSYGLIAPYVSRVTKPKATYTWTHVHTSARLPFAALAMPMAALLGVSVFLLEWFWSWEKDLSSMSRINRPGVNIATATAWPPFVSGILIGLLQVPLVLVIRDSLGGSSSYVTIVSQWVITEKLERTFPYLAAKRSGVGNWWQVFYVAFAVVGACVSGAASDTLSSSKGPELVVALFGGFFILFGSRLSAGCTSGHGLSGMALLAWLSFVAVPAMFAGAIALGYVMQATGALDQYVEYTGAL